MHEAGGAAADPVGVLIAEALHPRNDQTALGGVIRQVSGPQAPLTGQGACLLQGQAVTAHQHLQPAVAAQADQHANPRQEITDLLAHRDAVGTAVLRWWGLQVVVDAVQAADETVVLGGSLGGELAVAEVNPSVVADADEGALAGGGAVAAAPDPFAELDIPKRHRDLLAAVVHMPLVHRPGDVGQGSGVVVGLLLAVPALQQIQPHLARIEIKGVRLRVRLVAKPAAAAGRRSRCRCRVCALAVGQRWCDRHQKCHRASGHADGQPALAPPPGPRVWRRRSLPGCALWRSGASQRAE